MPFRFAFSKPDGSSCCGNDVGDPTIGFCDTCRPQLLALLANESRQFSQLQGDTMTRRQARLVRTATDTVTRLRTAAKSKPIPSDQQTHLDAAHDAIVSAGGSCVSNPSDDMKSAAGARNSEEDQASLDNAHDHLVAAGANCDPLGDDDDDGQGLDKSEGLTTALSEFVPVDPYTAGLTRMRAASAPHTLHTLSAAERKLFGGQSADIERLRNEQATS